MRVHCIILSDFTYYELLFQIVCQYLLTLHNTVGHTGKPVAKPPKVIAKEAQMLSARLLRDGAVKQLEILSLDILQNGLNSLAAMNAVCKEKRYHLIVIIHYRQSF